MNIIGGHVLLMFYQKDTVRVCILVKLLRQFRCADQKRLGSMVTKKSLNLSSLTEEAFFLDSTKSDVDP